MLNQLKLQLDDFNLKAVSSHSLHVFHKPYVLGLDCAATATRLLLVEADIGRRNVRIVRLHLKLFAPMIIY